MLFYPSMSGGLRPQHHLSFFAVAFAALSLASPAAYARDEVSSTATALPADASAVLSSAIAVSLSAQASMSQPSIMQAVPTGQANLSREDALMQLLQTIPPSPVNDPSFEKDRIQAIIEQITAANATNQKPARNLTARAGALKVLVVGDSMTHGQEGDWTWRYRMWQWFRQNNIDVDFVGPYVGTQVPTKLDTPRAPPRLYNSPAPESVIDTSGGYSKDCDPAFDSNHFGVWGRPVAIAQFLIKDQVAQYQPDIILCMLGFNDIGWFYSDAVGLVNNMGNFITNARQAKSNVKFVIGNVPMRTYIGGRQDLVDNTDKYNSWIPGKLNEWSTTQSPVAMADIRHTYSCNIDGCPAGYDGLHPSSLGDFQIASAFSKALYNSFKLGSGPLQVPSNPPARPVPVPSGLVVASSGHGVTAKWSPVYGAYGYHVQISINGGDWSPAGLPLSSNRWDSPFPIEGATYAIKVSTYCGELPGLESAQTDAQSAVAHPQTPPPPPNVKAYSSGTDLSVYWDAPTGPNSGGIIEYEVIIWDLDGCSFILSAGFTSSPAVYHDRVAGHRYLVVVSAWSDNGQGFPGIGNNVRIGSSQTPGGITGIQMTLPDDNNVYATWQESAGAAGYSVWIRNTLNSSDIPQKYGTSDSACWSGFVFYPANWCYEFCFEAWNGGLTTGIPKSQCIQPPMPASHTSPAPTCPPPKPWCPSFGQPANPTPGPGDTPVGGGGGSGSGGTGATSTAAQASATPSEVINQPPYDDGDDDMIGGYTPCPVGNYANLDAVNANSGSMSTTCLAINALDALAKMADTAYSNYTSVDNGYDAEFGYYVTYVKKLIPLVLGWQLMFTPQVDAYHQPGNGPAMQYWTCSNKKDGSSSYPCTDAVKKGGRGGDVYFTLNNKDAWNQAVSGAGISSDWVTYGDWLLEYPLSGTRGSAKEGFNCHGFPIINPSLSIPNPKDIVTKGISNVPDLILQIRATRLDMIFGQFFTASDMDPLQVYSSPVFALMQAVDSMAQVKTLGAQEEKAEKQAEKDRVKNLILLILGLVFLFVPVIGEEIATAAGLANLARVLSIAGQAGDVAMAIYGTVDDPKSAFVNIIGAIFGVAGIAKMTRDGPGIAAVSKIRQGMSAAEIASLGKIFKDNSDVMSNIAKVCRR